MLARAIAELGRYHPRSVSAPGATIRAIPGDLERLPAPVAPPAAGAGPAAVAAELLDIQGGGLGL